MIIGGIHVFLSAEFPQAVSITEALTPVIVVTHPVTPTAAENRYIGTSAQTLCGGVSMPTPSLGSIPTDEQVFVEKLIASHSVQ